MLDIPILTMSKENCTFAGGPRRTKVTSDAPAYFVIFRLIRELVHLSKISSRNDDLFFCAATLEGFKKRYCL